MDDRQLDDLTRLVASGSPRRRILGSLAAGLAAPLLPRSANLAGAACKKVGKKCQKGKDCCDKAKCQNGKCRCKDGFSSCSGKCKNLVKDEKHCGSCNTQCAAGEHCCDGDCVDRQTDRDHCGSCGNECSDGEECIDGACRNLSGSCQAGASYCHDDQPRSCNNHESCRCVQTTEGETFCGKLQTDGAACGQCETSADCAFIGPNAVCVANPAPSACCGPSLPNFCMLPCPI